MHTTHMYVGDKIERPSIVWCLLKFKKMLFVDKWIKRNMTFNLLLISIKHLIHNVFYVNIRRIYTFLRIYIFLSLLCIAIIQNLKSIVKKSVCLIFFAFSLFALIWTLNRLWEKMLCATEKKRIVPYSSPIYKLGCV